MKKYFSSLDVLLFFFVFFLLPYFSVAQKNGPERVKNQFIIQIDKKFFEKYNLNDSIKNTTNPAENISNNFFKNNFQEDFKNNLQKEFENIFSGKKINFKIEKILSEQENILLIHAVDSTSEKILSDAVNENKNAPISNLIPHLAFNHMSHLREKIPNDNLFATQWHLNNTGQTHGTIGADIKATKAWDITTGGKTAQGDDIVIALVDIGISTSHADLKENLWVNKYEIPNNGIDDDGNGYVDDYAGWNTTTNTDSVDGGPHGTEVAGVMGAVGNNGIGIAGVNWHVKIMTVVTDGTDASIIASYAYVLKQRQLYNESKGARGAFVVATNSSFGRDGFYNSAQMWCDFYDKLGAAGILSVGATDNANRNVDNDANGDIPSLCPSDYLIMVTSTDDNDYKVGAAAYGVKNIDVGAPGYNIYTTASGNNYTNVFGTSVACPMVTGLVGLAYAVPNPGFITRAKSNPAQAALYLKSVLLKTVDTLSALKCKVLSGGRINAFKTVNCINNNCNDTFVKTNCLLLAVTDVNDKENAVKIYPNPSNGAFTVGIVQTAGNAQLFSLEVFDVTGKNRMTRNGVQNLEPVQLPDNLPAGMYFVKITTTDKIFIRKLVKE